ncbi:MAG: tRNA-dihydrouridine synthase family protein [Candidatus Gracilibacteria bacterium]|nr:tRNA-dihydrouridine synthase family protein [Candidatus Gracilibacteria bacterium]
MKDFWQKLIEEQGKLCFLAPMDGYGDSAYRQVMKKVAPHIMCVTEFYSADGLVYSKTLADSVLQHDKIEEPLIVQIFGKEPENFAKAAKIIERYNIAGIDVNMGCPAKKVVKSGHGSGLMINEETAYRVVEELNKATKLPISVKTRLGFDGDDNLIRFAKGLENAGASLLTVHGRTAKQAYTGFANFEPIYELKKHIKIPLICNGDVKNYEDGMNKVKGLDGFMIGRATFGNPWVFLSDTHPSTTLLKEMEKGKFIDGQYFPTLGEILDIMYFHAQKLSQTKGERKGSLEIRKHLVCYLKNFPGVKVFRKKLVSVENLVDVENVINEIRNEYKDYLGVITTKIDIDI